MCIQLTISVWQEKSSLKMICTLLYVFVLVLTDLLAVSTLFLDSFPKIYIFLFLQFPVSTFVLLMPVAEDMIQIKDQSFLKEQWSLLLLLNIWFGHQCRLPISFLLMSRYLQFEVGCLRYALSSFTFFFNFPYFWGPPFFCVIDIAN
jgi:hypothetical protein